jgi:hypothetical protein
MTGCGHDANLERAHVNDRIVSEGLVIKTNASLCAGADHRTGLICQLKIPGNKIGVEMGIQNMCQLNPKLGRRMQISVHVPKRVDQDPFFCIVRADQIGRVAESRIHKRFDK